MVGRRRRAVRQLPVREARNGGHQVLLRPVKCCGFAVLWGSGTPRTGRPMVRCANCQPWRGALRWRVDVQGSPAPAQVARRAALCGYGQAGSGDFEFTRFDDSADYL